MWWAAAPQCLGWVVGIALLIFPLRPAMVAHLQDEQLCSAMGDAATCGSLDADWVIPWQPHCIPSVLTPWDPAATLP